MTPETSPPPEEAVAPATANFRGLLLSVALVFGFLIVILGGFYLEENWRGKRAWEKTKERLAAKGEKMEWNAFLPTPPPDESNMMKAPFMEGMLIKGKTGGPDWSGMPRGRLDRTGRLIADSSDEQTVRFAIVHVVKPGESIDGNVGIVDLDAVSGKAAAKEISRRITVSHLSTPAGFELGEKAFGEEPSNVYLRSSKPLSTNDVRNLLKEASISPVPRAVEQIEPNTYALRGSSPTWFGAREFLAWSEGEMAGLNALHEAAKRPECWLPGDYSVPFAAPTVNFVTARMLAQFAGARAQAYLLLNRPDEAMAELKRIDEIGRVLKAEPMTLVSAMLNVAVIGLQTSIIEQGFQKDVWKERHWREWAALSSKVEMLPRLVAALRGGERAGVCYLLEQAPADDVRKVMGGASLRGLQDPTSATWQVLPRGWLYQNLALYANLMQETVDAIDARAGRVDVAEVNAIGTRLENALQTRSPLTILMQTVTPNMVKAARTAARNVTTLRMAATASALELYRAEHRAYPKALADLVPKYLEAEPREVVSRAVLRYQLRTNGQYALYSIGWDESDDFAKALAAYPDATVAELTELETSGKDWVWTGVPEPSANRNSK